MVHPKQSRKSTNGQITSLTISGIVVRHAKKKLELMKRQKQTWRYEMHVTFTLKLQYITFVYITIFFQSKWIGILYHVCKSMSGLMGNAIMNQFLQNTVSHGLKEGRNILKRFKNWYLTPCYFVVSSIT